MCKDLINVSGVDSNGRLIVYITNPSDMRAVDRARLYHAAPELLAACQSLLDERRIDEDHAFNMVAKAVALATGRDL